MAGKKRILFVGSFNLDFAPTGTSGPTAMRERRFADECDVNYN